MKTIETFLKQLSSDDRRIFKRIYRYIHNLNNVIWDETQITVDEYNRILNLVNKQKNNIDTTFDIGFKYFRGNKLFVKEGVFVPQYDTEQILELIPKNIKKKNILEVGVGTGAISISLKKEFNSLDIVGIDINKMALELSQRNAEENKVDVTFLEQNIFDFKPKTKFDILISNPPYIDIDDENIEEWVKMFQPKNALYAGSKGYEFYEYLIYNHKNFLNENGIMIFEIGFNQAKKIESFSKKVKHKKIKVYKDLENKFDRFIVIEF